MRKQKTFVSCSPFRLASQSLSGAKEFDIYFYLNFLNNGRICPSVGGVFGRLISLKFVSTARHGSAELIESSRTRV